MAAKYQYYEFFAGGGMARLGLGADWNCLFANDFSPKKAASYRSNFPPADEFFEGDVFNLQVSNLPRGVDMAWASFPCQDLSLAGNGQGLKGHRSGSFWGFWHLIDGLAAEGRPVPLVVVENVVGTITANKGQDFLVLLNTLVGTGYRVGPMVIDAKYFVPQSRSRLFIVAVHNSVDLPIALVQHHSDPRWHPPGISRAQLSMPKEIKDNWIWWNMPYPAPRSAYLLDVLEDDPTGVRWHTIQETNRLLELMSPTNLAKVRRAQQTGRRTVGTIYRRIRNSNGEKRQRAEIRIDDLSGCLRTGSGGSSKQFIMIIEGERIASRLLSPREAARLMGVPDEYVLPTNYSEAYHLMGDGLVVPVVSWISHTILVPALNPTWIVEEAYATKTDGCQIRLLESRIAEMGGQTSMDTLTGRLYSFQAENNYYGKGSLSVALHITRYAIENGLPVDPQLLLTKKNGQVKGLGGGRIKRILLDHNVTRQFASEGGRTSRGSIDNMKAYSRFLNELALAGSVDLAEIEKWWVSRVVDFFASLPFELDYDTGLSFETMIARLLEKVKERQREIPGSTILGTVLQHLVGAKLELILGKNELVLQHHAAAVADTSSGRNGDFEIEDTVIHVTTSPAEALMVKCQQNLSSGLKPVVVTLFDQIGMARGNADAVGIKERLEVVSIEQFLTMNIHERSLFKQANHRTTITQIIAKYNLIIENFEQDPSLRIVLP